ncbi:MAG: MazG nucleotide pyrophosphohydrolase domain-containing protein [Planctomycetota bacterium]
MTTSIHGFQKQIEDIYIERDRQRGIDASFRWLAEEVGELAKAIRRVQETPDPDVRDNLREEFADVIAWINTIATMTGVDLSEAVEDRYANGCPKCTSTPCAC